MLPGGEGGGNLLIEGSVYGLITFYIIYKYRSRGDRNRV